MRVAFVGKGGAGKSVIAGTFARLLARRGLPVLAADSDPMPGLSLSLGCGLVEASIPDDAVEDRRDGEPGPRYRLRAGLSAVEAVERYAVTAPDGVRLLQFGKLRAHAGPLVRSQFAFRQILRELPGDTWHVVGDLPGGTRQPFFGWADYASTVLTVVEPTAQSLLSARRLARLAGAVDGPDRIAAVVSKARRPDDAALVRGGTGLDVVAVVPWVEAVGAAERRGLAPVDAPAAAPAVHAVAELVDRFVAEGAASSIAGDGLADDEERP